MFVAFSWPIQLTNLIKGIASTSQTARNHNSVCGLRTNEWLTQNVSLCELAFSRPFAHSCGHQIILFSRINCGFQNQAAIKDPGHGAASFFLFVFQCHSYVIMTWGCGGWRMSRRRARKCYFDWHSQTVSNLLAFPRPSAAVVTLLLIRTYADDEETRRGQPSSPPHPPQPHVASNEKMICVYYTDLSSQSLTRCLLWMLAPPRNQLQRQNIIPNKHERVYLDEEEQRLEEEESRQ